MMKDYAYLARCLVPMGRQIDMSMEEREELLKSKTRRFTEEEIQAKFGKKWRAGDMCEKRVKIEYMDRRFQRVRLEFLDL